MAAISRTPSPSSSKLSSPSSARDGTPTTITSSAVLFKGPPLSIFPSVAALVASQLRLSPPSPLKILDGTRIEMEKSTLDHFTARKQEYKLSIIDTSLKVGAGRRNYYSASSFHVPGRRYNFRVWTTVEIEKINCSLPPASMLSLFEGMVAFVPNSMSQAQHQLQQVIEIFGGQVVESFSDIVTHVVDLTPSNVTRRSYLDKNGRSGCLAIHPTWITSSLSHGFLLPTSLFSLDFENPLFQEERRYGESVGAFLDVFTTPLEVLSESVEFVLPSSPSLPSVNPKACFSDRRIFFDVSGPHFQLARALSSVVMRLGAQVVSDIRASNWVVTSVRSGYAYLHGIRYPENIMGTLEHLMAHLDFDGEEPIDPRSSLLYFPCPPTSDTGHALASTDQDIYISKRYPSQYRRYLSTLFLLMTRRFPLPSGDRVGPDTVIIAPSRQLYTEDGIDEDQGDLIILLPKYLEDSFLHFDAPPIFNVAKNSFRNFRFECFSPKKLPKNFHLAEFKGERIPDEMVREWCDLETRWEMHERFDEEKTCECVSCRDLVV